MKVIKTRGKRYHTDSDCQALDKASRNTKEIELETAKKWGLKECAHCAGYDRADGHTKWSSIVNQMKES